MQGRCRGGAGEVQGRWRGRLEGEAARGVEAACTLVRCRALRVEHALGLKRGEGAERGRWQGREAPSCVYCGPTAVHEAPK